MSPTEGILANSDSMYTSGMINPSYAPESSSIQKYDISDVAISFGQEYYSMMSYDPENLHCFYKKHSSVLHSSDLDKDALVNVGLEQIHHAVTKMGYKGARVIISNIDCQQTLNGGVLIFVLGEFTWSAKPSKKFAQSLVLAEQPGGYYVLNDILRILEEGTKEETTSSTTATNSATVKETPIAIAEPQVVEDTESPQAPSAEITPEETVAAVEQKTIAAEPKIIKTRAYNTSSKNTSRKSPPPNKTSNSPDLQAASKKEAAVSTSEASVEATAKPSSWAKLAAVQQSRWGNGVVAESKGPVASIPLENPTKKTTTAATATTTKTSNSNENGTYRRRQNNEVDTQKAIFVSGIQEQVEVGVLRKLFEKFGKIKYFDYVRSRGIAFIEFDTVEAKEKSLSSPVILNGKEISVTQRKTRAENTDHNNNDSHRHRRERDA